MTNINISHKKTYTGSIHSSSGAFDVNHKAERILADEGFWRTKRSETSAGDFVIIDYGENIVIDYIELSPSPFSSEKFPAALRFETSDDLSEWKIIHSENRISGTHLPFRLDLPLTPLRYLKIVIPETSDPEGKNYSEIGYCSSGIYGIKNVSSEYKSHADCGPENLFDYNDEKVWETEHTENSRREGLLLELGKPFIINKIILKSANSCFPESFSVELSEDGTIWHSVIEETGFSAEMSKNYYWDIENILSQYIRFRSYGVKGADGRFSAKISRIDILSSLFDLTHVHNTDSMTMPASIFKAGIVKLSKDGESIPGTVVQANDMRLRDASVLFKGIVKLADDGDTSEGSAVQASDSRLTPATDFKHGIVRLAYDREVNPGVVVQSNDSRLQQADENKFGIVRLCHNGMYTENAVLTGNDSRLHKATTENFGIIKLAENGESSENSVVQSNDRRLKDATIYSKGIVELSDDGAATPGAAVQADDRRLKDATTNSKGIVQLAENGEDRENVVVQANDRRLKDATTSEKGIVELAEDGEAKPMTAVQGNDRRLKDASTETRGISRFAEDGENAPLTAVQGNDKRLKEATMFSPGIVRLARDGETIHETAVQGNDKRLKDATTVSKGIVELAEDGENIEGVAVQGNDSRLKDASTNSKGIVQLAEDGEDRENVAIQGNDKRLKDATTDSKGIVKLASNGETSSGTAVQGNDHRLKDATTHSKGIVKLAENGEDSENTAVQGNDHRLKDATTHSKGIVELAENGEDSENVAVQGNDRRLKPATENTDGIVKLAKDGETRPGFAVQGNDYRLSDRREPLPHYHDYAPADHDYNSHSGTISIEAKKSDDFFEISPPPESATIIRGENRSSESGSVGIAGISSPLSEKDFRGYGILGHSRHIGVRGQSSGGKDPAGCGVLGISRFGAGGVFASEHQYSLIADGYGSLKEFDNSINLIGNGKALYVNGKSTFNGKIELNSGDSESHFPVNLVEYFEVDEDEFLSPGDILTASPEGKSILKKSSNPYSTAVIGIISGNPSFSINNSDRKTKIYPVVLAGKAMCKVDARKNTIKPGDLIVTSDTSGCGMKGKIDSFDKIGSVFCKALDSIDDGIGTIPVFITHK